MNFLVQIDEADGSWTRVVAWCSSEHHAIKLAKTWCYNENIEWEDVSAEMFNTFEHGDTVDYINL